MDVTQEPHGGVLVVAPAGRIDSTTSDALEQALAGAFEQGQTRVVIDFDRVDYISSAGLRVLLAAARRIRDLRGALVLCALTEPVRQVFQLAGFMPLFTTDVSRSRALARLSGPG